jgi:hypothetical protein
MNAMNEALVHYIWEHQLYNHRDLITEEGQTVQVVYPGKRNSNQGPDFSNARIRIGAQLWVGHVELHVRSSDWQLHGHSKDPNYRQVVLHVVWEHDRSLELSFPTLELKTRVPKWVIQRQQMQMEAQSNLICSPNQPIRFLHVWQDWRHTLVEDRLQNTAAHLLDKLQQFRGSWDKLSRVLFGRCLMGPVNADAMESLLNALPEDALKKHRGSLFELESLLFGLAGWLIDDLGLDDYALRYMREFSYQQKMHGLSPASQPFFFHRMRPGNFPTLRMSQWAVCLHQIPSLMSWLLSIEHMEELDHLEEIASSMYWNTHYRFGDDSSFKIKRIGKQKKVQLVINWAIPLLFAYGNYHGLVAVQKRAMQWLENTSPESNNIVRIFEKEMLPAKSALDTQAMIRLYKSYCSEKKCLQCSIGKAMLQSIPTI